MASTSNTAGDHNPGGAASGGNLGGDPAGQPGQYPKSLFGVNLPQDTGAAGTEGASPANRTTDAINQPGQYPATEPISGVTLGGTGAPGSQGAMEGPEDSGDVTVTYSPPGFYKSESQGLNPTITTLADISGPDDWTAPPGNYPPQHPLAGTPTPTSTGAGQGRVMRGGRQVG